MSVSTPVSAPPIPASDGSATANYYSIMALKQNLEITQGTRGVARASTLHGPTTVNTQIGAALRAVS
jgi:hypothetical protein